MHELPLTDLSPLDSARIAHALKKAKVGSRRFVRILRKLPADETPRRFVNLVRALAKKPDYEVSWTLQEMYPAIFGPPDPYRSVLGYSSRIIGNPIGWGEGTVDCRDIARNVETFVDIFGRQPTVLASFTEMAKGILADAGPLTDAIRRALSGTRIANDESACIAAAPDIVTDVSLLKVLAWVYGAVQDAPPERRVQLMGQLRCALANCIQNNVRISATKMAQNIFAVLLGSYEGIVLDVDAPTGLQMYERGVLTGDQLEKFRDPGLLFHAIAQNRPDLAAELIHHRRDLFPRCLEFRRDGNAILPHVEQFLKNVPARVLDENLECAPSWIRTALLPHLLNNGCSAKTLRTCLPRMRQRYMSWNDEIPSATAKIGTAFYQLATSDNP